MPDTSQPVEVTVLKRLTIPATDPQRNGKCDVVVWYTAPPNIRSSVRLPAETFSDAALAAAIRADLQEARQWQGKTLKV